LFDDYRYFFTITNDRRQSATAIVLEANDRCDQENLHAQLKGSVRSLTAPVDSLLSNWAYMVMTSLAWNLKAWFALSLPETGSNAEQRRDEKRTVLRMEFRTFVSAHHCHCLSGVRGRFPGVEFERDRLSRSHSQRSSVRWRVSWICRSGGNGSSDSGSFAGAA